MTSTALPARAPMAPFIEANGARIPQLGLGTWPMKGEDCAAAVAHALSVGYRHIDTAAMYENEAAVGEGIRHGGVARDAIFVTTKVWFTDIGERDLQRSAEASLKRLGLDQVDLLLIHWPNEQIPLKDSLRGLALAKRAGMARHIGIANFPSKLVDEAAKLSAEPLVANQCEYHPHLDQSRVIEAGRRHGIAFVSYTPLGRAKLFDERLIRTLADKYERTPAQIVLRWHMQQGVVAIPKSATHTRITENAAIFDFALEEAEMAALHALARPDGRVVNPAWSPRWDEAA